MPQLKKTSLLLPIITFTFISFLLYSNTFNHTFVWDDHFYIENRSDRAPLTFSTIISGNYPVDTNPVYRPIRNLFYPVTNTVFGQNPFGYHLFTTLIHALNSILVYLFVKNISNSKKTAWIGTLIFLTHPIHTEAIAWITAGFDQVFVTFYLLALIFYQNYRSTGDKKAHQASLVFSFLSVFSNELALTLPLLIITLDKYIYRQNISKNIKAHKYTSYFFIVGLFLFTRLYFRGSLSTADYIFNNLLINLLQPLVLLGKYLFILLIPATLNPDHIIAPDLFGIYFRDHNPFLASPVLNIFTSQILIFLFLSFFSIAATAYFKSKNPLISFFIIWIILTLLPVLQLIPQSIIFAERYAYLASIGYSALLGLIFNSILNSKKFKIAALLWLVTILLVYSLKTISQNQVWANDKTLWTFVRKHNPKSAIALNSLGYYYLISDNVEAALPLFEQANRLNPSQKTYQSNLASAYEKLGKYDDLIDFYNQLNILYPKNTQYLLKLGLVYETKLNNYTKAIEYYQIALDQLPHDAELQNRILQLQNQAKE